MKRKENKPVHEIVEDKLYLFNLLNRSDFKTYDEAKNSMFFRSHLIIEKLTWLDIEYLTKKIEGLL